MNDTQLPRVFVFGSCVSRDALEAVPGVFETAGYIARTSMASIGMPPVDDAQVRQVMDSLGSTFQRRMVANDLDKGTLSTIAATPHDVLLLDFIDERLTLVRTGESWFSYSGELQVGGLQIGPRASMAWGSAAFLSAWIAGFERFIASVDASTVVLNRAFWAERFPDGGPTSSTHWIRESNAALRRLYDAVDARCPLPCIDYPDDIVVADPAHRWGVSPYHYTQAFYEHTIASLRSLVDAR